jgi:hypothetical protein
MTMYNIASAGDRCGQREKLQGILMNISNAQF